MLPLSATLAERVSVEVLLPLSATLSELSDMSLPLSATLLSVFEVLLAVHALLPLSDVFTELFDMSLPLSATLTSVVSVAVQVLFPLSDVVTELLDISLPLSAILLSVFDELLAVQAVLPLSATFVVVVLSCANDGAAASKATADAEIIKFLIRSSFQGFPRLPRDETPGSTHASTFAKTHFE